MRSSEREAATETAEADRPRGGRLPRSARRIQLLDAARAVFLANGYHAAAMDEIADQAGVSKPVLYQHFPGKLELYLALLDSSCDTVIESVRQALASTEDNKARVTATMAAFFDHVDNDEAAFRLIFESDLTSDNAVRERIERMTSETAAAVAEVIQDDTGLGADHAHLIAIGLVGMAQVSARYWLANDHPLARDEAVTLVSGLAWRGIRGFPRTEPG